MSPTTAITRGAVVVLTATGLGWAVLTPGGAGTAQASPPSADDRQLGRQIAGHPRATPLATPTAAQEGRALGAALRWRGVRTVTVASDGTAQSEEQLAALAHSVTVVPSGGQATVLLEGVGAARHDLATRTTATYGVWIAPEMFTADLLGSVSPDGHATAPLQAVLPVDPLSSPAGDYLATLQARVPDRAPSYEGLLGWLDAHPRQATPPHWRLYVAGAAAALPPALDHDHASRPDWIADGGVNAASPVLEVT